MSVQILIGDCREKLRELPDASVHCCVTSPPYFGLRDYDHAGQMGLEPTPDEFVAGMVEVFREVRRVLRDDGTLWLNIGDSYADKQLLGVPWKLAEALRADGWLLRQDIIWNKLNAMPEPVRDPFGGAGTTGLVADRLGRDAILIELNPEYAEIARKRLTGDGGMFADVKVAA